MGALCRHVELVTRPGEARGIVEDDFHHFRVIVEHDVSHVTAARGIVRRQPWTLCTEAGDQLSALVGMPLSTRSAAVFKHSNQFLQCTHMLDLAGLCVALAAQGVARRTYEIAVPDRVEGRTQASLKRDGQTILQWELLDNVVLSPSEHAGVNMGEGFTRWSRDLPEEQAEAALVLRRGVFIARGRQSDLDARIHSASTGGCYVQQPERASLALRVVGSTRDSSQRRDELGVSDRDWLDFREDQPACS